MSFGVSAESNLDIFGCTTLELQVTECCSTPCPGWLCEHKTTAEKTDLTKSGRNWRIMPFSPADPQPKMIPYSTIAEHSSIAEEISDCGDCNIADTCMF